MSTKKVDLSPTVYAPMFFHSGPKRRDQTGESQTDGLTIRNDYEIHPLTSYPVDLTGLCLSKENF